jgi:hypothetical protein
MTITTLDEAIETVLQLPQEQQKILLDVVGRWQGGKGIVRDAQTPLEAYRAGDYKSRSTQQVITELHVAVAEEDFTTEARQALNIYENKRIGRYGISLLDKLLKYVRKSGMSPHNLPPVYTYSSEDGSLMLEWIFQQFRIGFSLEQEEEESSWFLVSTADYGGVQVSGVLEKVEIDPVMAWLVAFVTNNS